MNQLHPTVFQTRQDSYPHHRTRLSSSSFFRLCAIRHGVKQGEVVLKTSKPGSSRSHIACSDTSCFTAKLLLHGVQFRLLYMVMNDENVKENAKVTRPQKCSSCRCDATRYAGDAALATKTLGVAGRRWSMRQADRQKEMRPRHAKPQLRRKSRCSWMES